MEAPTKKSRFHFKNKKNLSSHGGNRLFFTVSSLFCVITPSFAGNVSTWVSPATEASCPPTVTHSAWHGVARGLGSFPICRQSQLFGWNLINQHNRHNQPPQVKDHGFFTNETEVMIGPTGSYNQRNSLPTTTNQLLNLHQRHCDVLVWLSKSRFHCLQASWMLRSL